MSVAKGTTKEEVIKRYTEMFGGYPALLLMGASDDFIIEALTKCIESGEEYEVPSEGDY